MENPFETIDSRLQRIEKLLEQLLKTPIDRDIAVGVPAVMTIDQISDYLHLSKSHLYKLTSQRDIPYVKKGKRLYFQKSAIDEWLLEGKQWTNDDIEKQALDYIQRNPIRF